MTPSATTTPEPPIQRPTDLRWGCVFAVIVGALFLWGAMPDFSHRPRMSGQLTAATLQASGIYKAMHLYALDHDGKFPTAETHSNQAFRRLFPDYIEDEKVFFVPFSAWHSTARNRRGPDRDIGSSPDYTQCLERGENHWAYVAGIESRRLSNLPLIADGFVENQPGTYTDKRAKRGGTWKGTKAVVVFADGSAKTIPLSAATHFRVLRPDPTTGNPVDIFTRDGGLPEGARVLNPD